ncbi:MAG: ribonuclease D [Balneolaceae bacterium]
MSLNIIRNNADLSSCISLLNKTQEFAIDLEFDKNYYRYGFNLCLVQIAAEGNCYLIDPLSKEMDIEKLFPLLEDQDIQKVVFAFGEDLRLLHSLGCFPKNLYDISTATSLLNYPPSSLTNLIAGILDVDTGKSSQKSNWYQRPLSEEQVNYAAQDVLHLVTLKDIFCKEAEENGVSEWITEENSSMDELNFAEQENNSIIKEKDKQGLTEHEWHLFKKLVIFRDEVAKECNKPGFKIIKKEDLKDLAKDSRHLMHWNKKKGIYRSLKSEEYKKRILELLKESAKEAADLGFSKTEPADKPLDKESYAAYCREKARVNKIKSTYFDPIKQKITEQYGKETASFIFSNRIITDLISNDERKLERYKRDIILEFAGELKLNPDDIFNSLN